MFIREFIRYHIPFLMILGMIYLFFKIMSDSIWLIHVHRSEFESAGKLVKNASLKLFVCLFLLQISTLVKFIGEENMEAGIIVLGTIILTYICKQNFNRNFIKPEHLSYDVIYPDRQDLERWKFAYQHPLQKD